MKLNTNHSGEPKNRKAIYDLMGNESFVIEEEFNKFIDSFRSSPLKDDLILYLTAMVDLSQAKQEEKDFVLKETPLLSGFDTNRTMFLAGARQVLSLIKYIAGK